MKGVGRESVKYLIEGEIYLDYGLVNKFLFKKTEFKG